MSSNLNNLEFKSTQTEKLKINVGFIGAGNMASAIAIRILNNGIIDSKQVFACAPTMRNLVRWKEDLKTNITHSPREIIQKCEVVFLAMKPYQLGEVANQLYGECAVKLIISVLAGIPLRTLRAKINIPFRFGLIRAIPNTAVEIGEGCTVFCVENSTSTENVKLAKILMEAGGVCEQIPENLMSIAAALSGCGIAYMYLIIEALSDGAVKKGLSRELSYKLAAQVMCGASKMVLETGRHPAKLKDDVCSPNGTTICGMYALEKRSVRAAMIEALEAATQRSDEIAESSE